MKILAIETSTSFGSIAIMDGKKIIAEEIVYSERSHNERLLPSIDALLHRCGLSLDDIELFGVGVGPGSFTGIRVGLSTVKALAYAKQKKIVGVSTLEAMSLQGKFYSGFVCPKLPAGRNDVYTALYSFKDKVKHVYLNETVMNYDELLLKLKEIEKTESLPTLFIEEPCRASHVGELSYEFAQKELFKEPSQLMPNYIRLPRAQEKLK